MSTASVLIKNPLELDRRVAAAAELSLLESLPRGFRFHPKDDELIDHYLKGKISGRIRSEIEVIPEVDVCKCEPWDLPYKSLIRSDDPEWFFFAPRDRKYASGQRSNRATEAGYWKATGKDRVIRSPAAAGPAVVGMKKTLVFHRGRAPRGIRTHWIMHEYRTTEPEYESGEQGGYVLYRLFKKSEDKSSNPNFDAVDRSGFSPAPSRSSPGAQNEPDTSEEFATPINQESPVSDLQEDLQSLSDTDKKQPAGIERWLADKSDCSTTYSVEPEKSHCNGIMTSDAGYHEAEVGAKVDTLLGVLAQSYHPQYGQIDSDGFPTVSSPMLPYMDYPFFGDINQGSHMGFNQYDNGENDFLGEVLSTMLGNQDGYSSGGSYAKKDSIVGMAPEGNISTTSHPLRDFAPGTDSVWGNDVDTEARVVAQGVAGLEGSDLLGRSPLWSTPYPEMTPHFGNHYENASPLPYDSAGPDVYSVDSGSESLQELFNGIEESTSQKNTVSSGDGLEGTGITIRARKPQNPPSSNNMLALQGKATRRIRLQRKLQLGPFSCDSTGSCNSEDDHEDKVATTEEGEHVKHQSAEGEISGPAHLDKLSNLSIHDEAASPKIKPTPSEMFQEAKPALRLRAKWNEDTGHRPEVSPLLQKTPTAASAAVYIFRSVLLVIILVLLSVGIWRCISSQCL